MRGSSLVLSEKRKSTNAYDDYSTLTFLCTRSYIHATATGNPAFASYDTVNCKLFELDTLHYLSV